jgi:hypothetical protein
MRAKLPLHDKETNTRAGCHEKNQVDRFEEGRP